MIPPDIPAAEAGAELTIDLGALAANWRWLDERARAAGASEAGAVVKADAYGTGIETAVPALWAAGCRTYFVAHLSEGRRVRAALPDAAIYVLNGLRPGTAQAYAQARLRPVLGSRLELEEWAAFRATSPGAGPAAIHVDTGMNRLGLAPEEALGSADLVGAAGVSLLMTHLVASEEPADPINAAQFAAFGRMRDAWPLLDASIWNSSAHVLGARSGLPCPPGVLTRPGYALYGGNPQPGLANPMRAVVQLTAPIVQVRDVPAGARVGYNGTWTARRPTRLATVSVGYADGWLRALSATDAGRDAGRDMGMALCDGVPCPLAGRVSMDLAIFDVTEADPARIARGRPLTLLGPGLDVDEVARRAGTNGYEILTSLGRRYARRVINA